MQRLPPSNQEPETNATGPARRHPRAVKQPHPRQNEKLRIEIVNALQTVTTGAIIIDRANAHILHRLQDDRITNTEVRSVRDLKTIESPDELETDPLNLASTGADAVEAETGITNLHLHEATRTRTSPSAETVVNGSDHHVRKSHPGTTTQLALQRAHRQVESLVLCNHQIPTNPHPTDDDLEAHSLVRKNPHAERIGADVPHVVALVAANVALTTRNHHLTNETRRFIHVGPEGGLALPRDHLDTAERVVTKCTKAITR